MCAKIWIRLNNQFWLSKGANDTTVADDVGDIIMAGVSSSIKQLLWMENSAHIIILEDEREQIFDLTRTFLSIVLEK